MNAKAAIKYLGKLEALHCGEGADEPIDLPVVCDNRRCWRTYSGRLGRCPYCGKRLDPAPEGKP